MLIYIKSGEAGWETERQIELPDDEKLVRAILRSVKRHLEPPKTDELYKAKLVEE